MSTQLMTVPYRYEDEESLTAEQQAERDAALTHNRLVRNKRSAAAYKAADTRQRNEKARREKYLADLLADVEPGLKREYDEMLIAYGDGIRRVNEQARKQCDELIAKHGGDAVAKLSMWANWSGKWDGLCNLLEEACDDHDRDSPDEEDGE